MREIPTVDRDFILMVDDEDYAYLAKFSWVMVSARESKYGKYFQARMEYEGFFWYGPRIHNLLMKPQKGMYVDHIDGNTLDNRRKNLRICTHRQNSQNTHKKSSAKTSQYKGVWRSNHKGNPWTASIYINRSARNLGYFDIEETAAEAYDIAASYAFGQFARLNFPEKSYSIETILSIRAKVDKIPPKRSKTSQFRGVRFQRTAIKHWESRISIDNKQHCIGRYSTPEEAAEAYDIFAYKMRGKKAILNFPDRIYKYNQSL